MAKNPFSINYIIKADKNQFGFKRKLTKDKKQKYKISYDKEKKIQNIFKNVFKTKKIDYEYTESLNKRSILGSNNSFFYTENNHGNSFLLIKNMFSVFIYNLDEINNNEVEDHLINFDSIYDCYKFKYKKEIETNYEEGEDIITRSYSVNLKKKKIYPK